MDIIISSAEESNIRLNHNALKTYTTSLIIYIFFFNSKFRSSSLFRPNITQLSFNMRSNCTNKMALTSLVIRTRNLTKFCQIFPNIYLLTNYGSYFFLNNVQTLCDRIENIYDS